MNEASNEIVVDQGRRTREREREEGEKGMFK